MQHENLNIQKTADIETSVLKKEEINHLHGKLLKKLASEALISQLVREDMLHSCSFSKSQFSRSNPD